MLRPAQQSEHVAVVQAVPARVHPGSSKTIPALFWLPVVEQATTVLATEPPEEMPMLGLPALPATPKGFAVGAPALPPPHAFALDWPEVPPVGSVPERPPIDWLVLFAPDEPPEPDVLVPLSEQADAAVKTTTMVKTCKIGPAQCVPAVSEQARVKFENAPRWARSGAVNVELDISATPGGRSPDGPTQS